MADTMDIVFKFFFQQMRINEVKILEVEV